MRSREKTNLTVDPFIKLRAKALYQLRKLKGYSNLFDVLIREEIARHPNPAFSKELADVEAKMAQLKKTNRK